jgi:N-acetylglutamate synthase-like GNAT family acetyltransferase
MQKLGFIPYSNELMPPILREACAGCYQEKQFPNCHCQYVESINLSCVEFTQLADIVKSNWNTQFYQVYQRMWRDAPWYENWNMPDVIAEMQTYTHKQLPQFILAHSENRLLGFSSGYFVTREQLAEKAGHDQLAYLFADDSMVFYLAEVGVVKGLRQNGIGRDLLNQLVVYALSQGASKLVARTKAFEAIQLIQKLGFCPTGIYDASDPQRQYFVK